MLASGVAPVIEERAAGIAVGLGTDGPAGSNNDLDLMEEMDLAAKLQKITKMDPRALGAKSVVEMATIEGAKALHMEKEIGSLEVGKKADIILISLDEPNAVPMYRHLRATRLRPKEQRRRNRRDRRPRSSCATKNS